MAQVALLLKLTSSAVALSSLLLASVVPSLLLALLGGALADRIDRRRLLVIANTIRGILMGTFTLIVILGIVQLWHLYVLALLYGGVSAFANPAFDALLPSIVVKERLQNANALFMLGDNIAAIAGPALGGLFLLTMGAGGAAAINTVSFLLLVFGLLIIKPTKQIRNSSQHSSIFNDIGNSLSYARSNKTLLNFLGIFAVINISAAVLSVSLPLFITQVLKENLSTYGIFLTSMNIGIFLGISIIGGINISKRGLLIIGSVFASGSLGYITLGLSREVWLGLIAVCLIDGLSMISNVLYPAWVQSSIPEEYRGRVFGLTGVVSYSLVPVGYVVAGVASSSLGPSEAIIGSGILLMLIAIISLLIPGIRTLK